MMHPPFPYPERARLGAVPVVALFRHALKRACLEQGQACWQEQVAQVADTLSPEIAIWQIEASIQLKAAIAREPHKELYRGFLLCCDAHERTFLLDTRSGSYVAASHASLLQIDGLRQARHFVDALHRMQAA